MKVRPQCIDQKGRAVDIIIDMVQELQFFCTDHLNQGQVLHAALPQLSLYCTNESKSQLNHVQVHTSYQLES